METTNTIEILRQYHSDEAIFGRELLDGEVPEQQAVILPASDVLLAFQMHYKDQARRFERIQRQRLMGDTHTTGALDFTVFLDAAKRTVNSGVPAPADATLLGHEANEAGLTVLDLSVRITQEFGMYAQVSGTLSGVRRKMIADIEAALTPSAVVSAYNSARTQAQFRVDQAAGFLGVE